MAEDAGIGNNKKHECLEAECSVKGYVQVDIATLHLIFGVPYLLTLWEGDDRARQLSWQHRNMVREENESLAQDENPLLAVEVTKMWLQVPGFTRRQVGQ